MRGPDLVHTLSPAGALAARHLDAPTVFTTLGVPDHALASAAPGTWRVIQEAALAADVVVVNHHLFFADLVLRDEGAAELLPACNTVIFDEAHQLPETASLFFGESVSTSQLIELARDARLEATAAAKDYAPLPEAARGLEAEVEAHRATLATERDRLEALRLEQVRTTAERVDLMRQAGELRERQAQLSRRAERLTGELAEAQGEATRLTASRATLEAERDRAVLELGSLAAERERLSILLDERAAALADAEARLAAARQWVARNWGAEAEEELFENNPARILQLGATVAGR